MALAPGTLLDGYEILTPLGSGGMGDVYRARDPILKREVAIKVLPTSVAQDAERLRRFEQEAQAAAALDHPNILAIHRFGVFDGSPYIVSELLEGSTLRQVEERGPLPTRKAIEAGVQTAHGLAAAHEKGIVHRDLKPENLFVTKDGRVKILDFGLVKVTQPRAFTPSDGPTQAAGTEPGVVLGTVGYMAPEQVRGLPTDNRTDIFAFGAVLYEMLSGKRAFQRSTSADTMAAILNEDPQSISTIGQIVPLGLQRVVQRCLEKNPEQRFQSASDLAFALEALSESGVARVTVAPSRPVRKWLSRVAGAAAIAIIAVAAALSIARVGNVEPLRITEYTQLTHDGHAGAIVATDGSRLYLQTDADTPVGQVGVSGGEIRPISIAVQRPTIDDLSPDGSTFLVESNVGDQRKEVPLFSIPVLGGAQRYLGKVTSSMWCLDGKSIVYTTAADDSIYVMHSDGSAVHKLIAAAGSVNSWSPDGKSIVFKKEDKFWEASPSGSDMHELLPGWRPDHGQYGGNWSPDGRHFIFLSNPGPQIWAIDRTGNPIRRSFSQPAQLTSGPVGWSSPTFSKDGTKIYATGRVARGELDRLDPKSNHFEPFLGGISANLLSFSRDGKYVAYVSFPECSLWRANIDGSQPLQLADSSLCPMSVSWSPDGSQIAFMSGSSQHRYKTYVVPAQGGVSQLLLSNDSGSQTDPRWSPDGSKIIFGTGLFGSVDQTSTIQILDVASRKLTTLPGSSAKFSPNWSSDGKYILASTGGTTKLFLFDVARQRWSTLYEGQHAYPSWSKDNRSIYLIRYAQNPAILRISVPGGVVKEVVSLKDFRYTGTLDLWMGVDPDDAPLMLRDVSTSDIYALTVAERPK